MKRPFSAQLHPRLRSGFTLIELIVAVSVTSILLLLVSRVFNETTKAINIGADTSQIVANSRTLNDQIFQDTARMHVAKAPPILAKTPSGQQEEAGGFLVLIQQRNSGVRFPDPDRPRQPEEEWANTRDFNDDGDSDDQDAGERLDIRTDQIAFFSPADKSESITPGSTARYDSDAYAQVQRVWYGHVARANLDGSAAIAREPGQAPDADDDFDQTLVSNLVLGRQGLLILDDESLWPEGQPTYERGSGPRGPGGDTTYAFAGAVEGGFTLATRIDQLIVDNVPSTSDDTYDLLHGGATDVMRLRDASPLLNFGSRFADFFELAEDGAQVDGLYATGEAFGINTLRTAGDRGGVGPRALTEQNLPSSDPEDLGELPTEDYARHALGWAFATPANRPLTTQDLAYPFEPAELGRNHTFFVPYVSDFAVDFAADIIDDYAYADDPATVQVDPLTGNTIPLYDFVLLPWWDDRWLDTPTNEPWRRFDPSRLDDPSTTNVDERWVVTSAANSGERNFEPDGLPDGRPDEYVTFDLNGSPDQVGIKWYNMAFDAVQTGSAFGNPVFITGPRAGEPFDRTAPAFYRLPRRVNPIAIGSPYPVPTAQTDGAYHTITAAPSNQIDYPPLVGFVNDPITPFAPGKDVLAYESTPAIPGNVQARAVFVFGHTSDYDLNNPLAGGVYGEGLDEDGFEAGSAKWWPYALRIRYRLHDGDGTYSNVGEVATFVPTPADPDEDRYDALPGKWFEQIVPVPHHDNHLPETNRFQ